MTTDRIFLDERSADRDEVLANAARAAGGLDAIGVREGDAVAQGQVTLFEVGELEAARGGSKEQGECGVLGPLDVADGIHHDTETNGFSH